MARSAPTRRQGDRFTLHAGGARPLPKDWRTWLDALPEELRDAYEERAALIEYDGGEKRRTAERRAFECVVWRNESARNFLDARHAQESRVALGDGCAQAMGGAGA